MVGTARSAVISRVTQGANTVGTVGLKETVQRLERGKCLIHKKKVLKKELEPPTPTGKGTMLNSTSYIDGLKGTRENLQIALPATRRAGLTLPILAKNIKGTLTIGSGYAESAI